MDDEKQIRWVGGCRRALEGERCCLPPGHNARPRKTHETDRRAAGRTPHNAKHHLKQAEAAEILMVSRPRVSDVVNKKTAKFTIDTLVEMLSRVGK